MGLEIFWPLLSVFDIGVTNTHAYIAIEIA